MSKRVVETKCGPVVQWTIYVPLPIHEKFLAKALGLFKKPSEAARDAFREYTEKQ